MNSLIKYGLYFVVAFSVLAFGAAEVGKTAAYAPAVLAHSRGRKLRHTKEAGGQIPIK